LVVGAHAGDADMLRRRAEEMKSPSGDMEEDDNSLLSGPAQLQADSPDTDKKRRRPHASDFTGDGSWTPTFVLAGVLAVLFLTIWTLPAPTFFGKLGLLRQSWRINAVLDESEQLREQLAGVLKTHGDLQKELTTQQTRAKELQRRLDASGGETVSLRRQVADETVMVSGLQGSNSVTEADFQKQRSSRLALLHKLQSVKQAELKDIAGLESVDHPITDAQSTTLAAPGATGTAGATGTVTTSAQATKSGTTTKKA